MVKTRRLRRVHAVPAGPEEHRFGSEGRPNDRRRPIAWISLLMRLLTIAWAGAIMAALLDAFGPVAHLPLLTAMGMTGLLVAASFLWTRPPPDIESEPRERKKSDSDDGARDLLTDLPTFNHFSRRLGDEFVRSRRMGRQVSVVLIDVNNLTAVNNEYGVKAGDEVLRHVAKVVDSTSRFNDVVARLGDDEFGVVLLETGDEGVRAFISRLEDRLARESAMADVGGRSIALWAGICSGIAVSNPEMTKPEDVLDSAMASLNEAKQDRERRRRTWLSA